MRDEVLEDIALARAVKRAGGRIALADGSALAECRMYDVVAGAARRLHQVAVGVVRLAGRRGRRRGRCCSLLYVCRAAALALLAVGRAGRCGRCGRRTLLGVAGPGRRRPRDRRAGLARRAGPPGVGRAVRLAGRAGRTACARRWTGSTWRGTAAT